MWFVYRSAGLFVEYDADVTGKIGVHCHAGCHGCIQVYLRDGNDRIAGFLLMHTTQGDGVRCARYQGIAIAKQILF